MKSFKLVSWLNHIELLLRLNWKKIQIFVFSIVAPDIAAALKIVHEKERISGILFFNGEWSLFKESPPSIMVTRNPNWSTEILWFGTGYVKGKILSPLKHPA
jgi:hypothetical protein